MSEQTLQDQLTEVENKLAMENQKGAEKNPTIVAGLERQQSDLIKSIEQTEQDQAAQLRIQTETKEVEYFLDNLEFNGITMRELFMDEQRYQFGRIAVQAKLIEFVERYNDEIKIIQIEHKEFERAAADRELQLQRQNDELQKITADKHKELEDSVRIYEEMSVKINSLERELSDIESKRDAAVSKADGLELLVSEKQAQIDILREESFVGARNVPNVINLESQKQQMQALAEQIKANRIRIYDVVPDNEINPRSYTAKRCDNGEEVTYNWTQERNYTIEKDEALVSQFRQQHAQGPVQDNPLDETNVAVEVVTPALPEVTFPPNFQVPSGSEVDRDTTVQSGNETVEERLAALEAHVFGFVKGQEVA